MQINPASNLVQLAIALLDLMLITVAFFMAVALRFDGLEIVDKFIWLYYLSAPLILFLLLQYGVLTGYRFRPLREIVKSTLMAFVVTGVVSSTFLYLSKTGDFSRLVFGTYFLLATVFVLFEKVVLKKLLDANLRQGRMNARIAVIGFGRKFDDILGEMKQHPQWGLAATLVIDPRKVSVDEIVARIRSSVVDEVYIAYARGEFYHQQVDELLGRLEKIGLPVRVALNFNEFEQFYGQQYCTLGSKAGVMLSPYNLDPDQLIMKRILDVAGSLVGLFLLALLLPFVALAIKLDSSGPVLFSQVRVGKGGREFRILKFRSMYVDAEQRKQELLQHNVHAGALFKMENDPRITRVGRFIRKYSIDEIPQFWNVLLGDMSLVGTRPPTRDEVAQYSDEHYRRITIKPGVTGMWQVSGRNSITDFDEVVALDVKYIKHWNLWLDVKIILRTLAVVLLPGQSRGM